MTTMQINAFVENVALLDGETLTGAEIYQLAETGDFQFDNNELYEFCGTHFKQHGNKVLVYDNVKYKLALGTKYTLVVNLDGDISVL